jgi:hypothetical protein
MGVFLIWSALRQALRGDRALAITNDLKRHHPAEKHSLQMQASLHHQFRFDRIAQDD